MYIYICFYIYTYIYICIYIYVYIYISHVTRDTLYNTLQHTCNTLQHAATHRNTPWHTATHRNTPRHTATHYNTLKHSTPLCTPLQHTAPHCNTLQHTATHCNTLQHCAPHRNTLPHSAIHLVLIGITDPRFEIPRIHSDVPHRRAVRMRAARGPVVNKIVTYHVRISHVKHQCAISYTCVCELREGL